jgi:Flp pilus assembly protein TadG
MYASSRRPTEAGQSVVELAVAVPVLVLLLMSVFNITVLISDRLIAGYATRTGARMAAELGDGQGGLSTAQVDQQIVESVFASSSNLDFAAITRIDIYRPSRADGAYVSTDLQDSYDINRNAIGVLTYPVNVRKVTPPAEDSIAVRIVWQYTPTIGVYSFTATLNEYTVMKAAPVLQ